MPVAPSPMLPLPPSALYPATEAIDGALLKVTPGGTADHFLSLLNISTGLADAQQFVGRGNDETPPAPRPNKEKATPAAPDAPEPLRRESRTQPVSTPAPTEKPADAPREGNANAHADKQDAKPAAAISSAQAPGEDEAVTGKKLRAGIQEQLDRLDELLAALIQAWSTVTPQRQSTQETAADGISAATPADGLAVGGLSQPQAGTFDFVQNSAPADATAGLQLLKDLQALLRQWQDSLQDGSSDADLRAETLLQSDADPDAQMLQAMARLNAWLTLRASGGEPGQQALRLSAAGAAETAPEALGTFKSAIADIRAQLRKLQAQNEALLNQSLQDASGGLLAAADTPLKETLDGTESGANDLPSRPVTPFGLQAALPAATPLSQQASLVTAPTPATPGQDASSQGDSGGQPGQGAAQPAAPAAAAAQNTNSAGGTSFSRLLDQTAAPPLLEQVAFHIKTALRDGSSRITLQLNPEELGKLEIRLNVSADGTTDVSVIAEHRHTLDLLRRDMHELTRALADAGLKTDSGALSFSLSGGQQEQRQDNAKSAMLAYPQQPDAPDENALAFLTRSYVVTLSEGLDIRV